jgi:hypothetical protein
VQALIASVAAAGVASPFMAQAVAADATAAPKDPPDPGSNWTEQDALAAGQVDKQVIEHADGSTEYRYTSKWAEGTLHIYDPPADFTPLTASADELVAYGFPPRPSGGEALDRWLDAMKSYRRSPAPQLVFQVETGQSRATTPAIDEEPTPDATAARYHAAGPPFSYSSGSSASNNWAGYVSTPTSGVSSARLIAAQANSYVHTFSGSPGCASNGVDDSWVGLGGFGSSHPLIQDGIGWNVPVANAWSAWYEVLQAGGAGNIGPNKISNSAIALNPGDGIFMYVDYQSANQQADFYVQDTSTGQVSQFQKTGVNSSYWDGSSADWITEKVAGRDLKHFTPVNWYSALAETASGTWGPVNNFPNYKVYNTNTGTSSGHLISSPNGLGGGGNSWTHSWYACN